MSDLAIILLLILGALLLYRGPRVLPRLGESLGRGVRDARHAAKERFGRSDEGHQPPE